MIPYGWVNDINSTKFIKAKVMLTIFFFVLLFLCQCCDIAHFSLYAILLVSVGCVFVFRYYCHTGQTGRLQSVGSNKLFAPGH